MKSILQSLSKDECFRIANGQQTITRVKRVPKTETPFKVYVHMEMGNVPKTITTKDGKTMSIYEFEPMLLSGRVIMEYICDSVDGNDLHISALKIYDTPRELGEFRKPLFVMEKSLYYDKYLGCNACCCNGCDYAIWDNGHLIKCNEKSCEYANINRPPKSWQYVEEV